MDLMTDMSSSSSSLRAKRSNPVQRRCSGLLRRFAPRNDVIHLRWTASFSGVNRWHEFPLDLRHPRRIAIGRRVIVADLGQKLAGFCRLALPVPHAGIEAAVRQQLLMSAALYDDAVV